MKFRHHKYTWAPGYGFGPRHQWEFLGPLGGVCFTSQIFRDDPSCGLEFHHTRACVGTLISSDEAPHHTRCWLTGEPCWHDGTSTYANESVWPVVQGYLERGEHEEIFRFLEGEYRRHFEWKPAA